MFQSVSYPKEKAKIKDSSMNKLLYPGPSHISITRPNYFTSLFEITLSYNAS